MSYFKDEHGFGKHRDLAINLLGEIVSLLKSFDINYFLISGTLLGYVRHNDFIPWDDDIDLIVDSVILNQLTNISSDRLTFLCQHNIIKVCFKNEGIEIQNDAFHWKEHILNGDTKYNWPFVDLFPYTLRENEISLKRYS